MASVLVQGVRGAVLVQCVRVGGSVLFGGDLQLLDADSNKKPQPHCHHTIYTTTSSTQSVYATSTQSVYTTSTQSVYATTSSTHLYTPGAPRTPTRLEAPPPLPVGGRGSAPWLPQPAPCPATAAGLGGEGWGQRGLGWEVGKWAANKGYQQDARRWREGERSLLGCRVHVGQASTHPDVGVE